MPALVAFHLVNCPYRKYHAESQDEQDEAVYVGSWSQITSGRLVIDASGDWLTLAVVIDDSLRQCPGDVVTFVEVGSW